MVRVLQVFGILNRGGAETMIMNYYRNIERENVQFDFAVNFKEEGAYEAEIAKLGGRVFRLPRFKGYNILSFVRAWHKLLKEHPEWEIIHVHNFKIAGLIFPIAKMLKRKCRIVHMHTSNPTYTASRKIGYEITKSLANNYATHLLACGDKAGLCYYGSRPFTVLNNAVDTSLFKMNETTRATKRKDFDFDDKFVIGHVGNFSPVKNHGFIIRTFEKIYREEKNARLLLVGDGSLRGEMEELVKSLNLEQVVHFAGSRSDVAELMMAMDAFIFPSHFEGFPVTIIEVQASRMHALISDVITDEVVVTNLVDKMSLSDGEQAWATKLLSYKGADRTNDLIEQIVEAGYDIKDNVKRLENLYLQNS